MNHNNHNNHDIDVENGLGNNLTINLSSPSLRNSSIHRRSTVNYSDSDPESEAEVEAEVETQHHSQPQQYCSDDSDDDDSHDNNDKLLIYPDNNIQCRLGTRVKLDNDSTRIKNSNYNNSFRNNIEIDKRSDAGGSVHLDEIDLNLNINNIRMTEYNHTIKLKYLFPTLKYKKLKMDKIMGIIDDQFEKDIVTILSNHLDIIASYLSCQKILYMEASHYTSSWLNLLMIPTIIITSTCSVLSGTDLYDYSLLISSLTAFSSLLLAIINYLKLDAASEAHKISSHQYDKLQSQTEFLSGNTLLFSTSSFNSHTISNRKKQNIAQNLSNIRENQKKIFDDLEEEYDNKIRSDIIHNLVNKRIDEFKKISGVDIESDGERSGSNSSSSNSGSGSGRKYGIGLNETEVELRKKIESDIRKEIMEQKNNKKEEITNRLRIELKNLNAEYDYCFADEEMNNHNDIIVKIRSEMENIKNKIKDIKETNQFVIQRDISYRYPTVYNTNVFTWIKTIEEYKMYLANQLLDIKNNLNYLNKCIHFSIEQYQSFGNGGGSNGGGSNGGGSNGGGSNGGGSNGGNHRINLENINNVLQKLRKKRRYFKGLKRTVNSKLINLGTAFKDVDSMFKQEILNAENKVKFRFRLFILTSITNILHVFFNICCCCCSNIIWNVDEVPLIAYLKRCKQKYIKDGIEKDSVLYEILKSRDGNTEDVMEQKDLVKSRSSFGDFFKMNISDHGGGGISGDSFVPPNYDSDDSDAKLSDWDC